MGRTKRSVEQPDNDEEAASGGFSAAERAAMKERASELKSAGRRSSPAKKAADAQAVLTAIAALPEPDRALAMRIHAIITTTAPHLDPRLWYGMPAYACEGKIVCFFQSAQKFQTRYATLGFTDTAQLDDGPMWPTAFAVTDLTPDIEARIAALIDRASRTKRVPE